MSISSVATRMGIPLDQHSRNSVLAEMTIRRNDLWAQGYFGVSEDELIEEVIEVLFNYNSRRQGLIGSLDRYF